MNVYKHFVKYSHILKIIEIWPELKLVEEYLQILPYHNKSWLKFLALEKALSKEIINHFYASEQTILLTFSSEDWL